ncbi:MAG TPA: alpha/beta hydrolase [Acetobacteraceae bacterium]|nr:alpha/beta hydrolase [Acetobacteraceae bacterium]
MNGTPNILLVHGAWADGSSWSRVIPLLQAERLNATAVQLPLTSLDDDVATVKRAIALEDGPILLVGHSYGGVVITQAGVDPKVAGLVYVTAFAPDIGESVGSLASSAPPAPLTSEIRPDANGFLKLTRAGVLETFAQGLSDAEKNTLFALQAPTSGKVLGGAVASAAWKTKPSWYIVTTNDRAIPQNLERTMAVKINAHTISIAASHAVMLSRPREVASLIIEAVR